VRLPLQSHKLAHTKPWLCRLRHQGTVPIAKPGMLLYLGENMGDAVMAGCFGRREERPRWRHEGPLAKRLNAAKIGQKPAPGRKVPSLELRFQKQPRRRTEPLHGDFISITAIALNLTQGLGATLE